MGMYTLAGKREKLIPSCSFKVFSSLLLLLLFSPSQSSAVDLKTKEEKDAELDKRIEALRKKNEALVKRYQVRGNWFLWR